MTNSNKEVSEKYQTFSANKQKALDFSWSSSRGELIMRKASVSIFHNSPQAKT